MINTKKNFDIQTFKEILNLRDGYARRRQNERLDVIDRQFVGSNKLAKNKHNLKIDFLNHQEKFAGNRHIERIEIMKERIKLSS